MTYDNFRLLFIIAVLLAGVFLLISIILFIIYNIPSVIGDLSGVTAKKAIDEIRSGNAKSGVKVHKESTVNKARGKLTEKISSDGTPLSRVHTSGFGMGTAKIGTAQLSAEAKASVSDIQTTLLEQVNETSVLEQRNETSVLEQRNETSVLEQNNETTVLNSEQQALPCYRKQSEQVRDNCTVDLKASSCNSGGNVTVSLGNNNTGLPLKEQLPVRSGVNEQHAEILYDITIVNSQEIIR